MKVSSLKKSAVILGAAGMLMVASSANAVLFHFIRITDNGNGVNLGGQLSVDVVPNGSGVDFKFSNAIGTASSITDIYFDDGTLLGISTISSSVGVAFTDPANPGDLPGGNDAAPDFVTTADFSADSDAPASANGVNSVTEWVTITFALQGIQTYADTLAALADGSLRIGLHVQAIGAVGGSDSYINFDEPGDLPLPDGGSTMALLGLSLFGAEYARRRFLKC